MMMRKQFTLNLNIPEPCKEGWENMTPNEKGRHCARCNKTVVDFTQYSDRALIDFFSKAQGEICGRISSLQMGRQIVYTESSRFTFLYKFLFGTAMTLGLAGSANGNYNPANTAMLQQATHIQPGHAHKKKKQAHKTAPQHFIEGYTRDVETTRPLSFVSIAVMYQHTKLGEIMTGIDGYYSFELDDTLIGKEITLCRMYEYGNYEPFAQKVKIDTLPYMVDIFMQKMPPVQPNTEVPVTFYEGRLPYVSPMRMDIVCTRGESSVTDVKHPDTYTLHKGDTPYW